jgi:hypothetical protein
LAVTKANRNTTPKSVPTPIVRDNTFSRAVVDKTLVMDLGRDMEIACFQVGPELAHVNNTAKGEEFDAPTVLTEVVRLRLPWNSAVNLAMNILQPAIAKDMIEIDGFIKAIDGLRSKAQSRSRKKVSSGAE